MVDGVIAGQENFRDWHDLVALGKEIVEDAGQGLGRVLARVVEEHDRAACDLARHALCDLVGGNALPVERIPTGSTWKRLRRLVFRSLMSAFLPAIMTRCRTGSGLPPFRLCIHRTYNRSCRKTAYRQ